MNQKNEWTHVMMKWLPCVMVILGWLLCGIATDARGQQIVIDLPGNPVPSAGFIGFGAEWDPGGYVWHGFPNGGAAQFQIAEERVRWMRLPAARVMMLTRWCYVQPNYVWDTPEMVALCRQLDLLQEIGTTVILTDWGASEGSWTTAPGITGADDPLYAQVIGTYLDYLVNQRGYTCIKYLIMNNEPNLGVPFATWKAGILNVAGELAARGLDHKVKLAGSDTTAGDSQVESIEPWHKEAVIQLNNVLGMYSIHHYGKRSRVKDGWTEGPWYARRDETFQNWWHARWQYVRDNDPNGASKPCIVGEAGMDDNAAHPNGSPYINDHNYGVFMADYAVQAARAGTESVLAWMLDDNSHVGFYWGLWSNAADGMVLRPWFYPWALLSRYFPAGATIHAPSEPEGIRVLAAESGGEWTFCLVNRRDSQATVTLQLPETGSNRFNEYRYAAGQALADSRGFPLPVALHELSTDETLTLALPEDAVVILAPAPPAEIWVDFAWTGAETGTFAEPYSRLANALPALPAGWPLKIKGDTSVSATSETPRITKALLLSAHGGPVQIGAAGGVKSALALSAAAASPGVVQPKGAAVAGVHPAGMHMSEAMSTDGDAASVLAGSAQDPVNAVPTLSLAGWLPFLVAALVIVAARNRVRC
jgi:hypothetical protein